MGDVVEQVPIAQGSAAYRRLTLAMLLAGFATFSQLYSVQPLLPIFGEEFHLSAEATSLAVSMSTGPLAIAILVAGSLSDRVGRRGLMIASLLAAGALTLVAAVSTNWPLLLAARFLTGLALAGVPSVAMAYVAEEVDAQSVGAAMGLYIAGSAIGGMLGRLGVSLVTDIAGWHAGLGFMGLSGLACSLAFWALIPASRGFVPAAQSPRIFWQGLKGLMRDKALPLLYLEGFLLMGVFVTIYNYAGFLLMGPPYRLGQAEVGAIFLLYILGSISSSWTGTVAGRIGRRRVFWIPIVVLLAGGLITLLPNLWMVILGIAVVTVGFFGAHSVASSWVGRRATSLRGQGTALYLFFYYLGSSLLGSAGGFAWTHAGWGGVVGFVSLLSAIALIVGLRLISVPPLPLPESKPLPVGE